MEYIILTGIGLAMGIFGGLLGIGGSLVMIPSMVLFFGVGSEGQRQHLYQASAMICNFFVTIAAVFVHKREKFLLLQVLKWLIPGGIAGIIAGVWLSNTDIFSAEHSRNLVRIFGVFLLYVAGYNIFRMRGTVGRSMGLDFEGIRYSSTGSWASGFITGIAGGLLGIGGGTVCTPMQQLLMKMPLKRAMANSTALIVSMSLIGAAYKNGTLEKHGFALTESLRIAAVIMPTAVVGGMLGAKLMHLLPKEYVRVVFIILLIAASLRMLTA